MGVCEFCGQEGRVATHHLIPRWLGGLNGDTTQLCDGCHRRFEIKVSNFIKYGSFHKVSWNDREKERAKWRRYKRRYHRTVHLNSISLGHGARFYVNAAYNRHTDNWWIDAYLALRSKGVPVLAVEELEE